MMVQRWLSVFILAFLIGFAGLAKAQNQGKPAAVMAVNVLDLNLDVDTTLDIGGSTRFFSSRHQPYAGGRITAHTVPSAGKFFKLSGFGGLTWGKSAFLLNWEEPGLQSFTPLEGSFWHFAVPLGMDATVQLGNFFRIGPYASAKMMWLRMNVRISDEDFSGSSFKIGFDAGVRAALNLGKLTLTGGVGWNHILNDEIEFDVDDLTFDSRTSGSSPEYFLGVEL
jgi:hypothetical protein